MSQTRIEKDSMGELAVPVEALYGAQTQRAINNFPISGIALPAEFIKAVALIKKIASQVNQQLGLIDEKVATGIQQAASEIIAGQHSDQFPVDVFQTGSGTSTNMNVNEVIATLAQQYSAQAVSANDHVNMGQSSNDVIPTAIHISAALLTHNHLIPALKTLLDSLESKAVELKANVKTGRTHLMDAMPVRMGQELGAWAAQIRHGLDRLHDSLQRIYAIAQGGTAVGTGVNAHPEFSERFAQQLAIETRLAFKPNASLLESLSCQDAAVEFSGQLKVIAVSMMKIANDLRWMNSGPLAGLGEIALPALQPGSSIMPGKVNPVIPEAVCMVSAQVIGNDATITIGGQSGNFQLNVMLPVIAYNLLQSIELQGNAARLLAEKAIDGFIIQEEKLQDALGRNPILVTALNPIVGYLKAAEIAKTAYKQARPVIDVAEELTDIPREKLEQALEPVHLTKGGLESDTE